MTPAPWLVLAVGNPSRGDDALGPTLIERLRAAGVEAAGDVELLVDFQLQVEHAIDLRRRRGVLFVDAARPGAARGATLARIRADSQVPPASHALRAEAVLHVATTVDGAVPPAWQLAIEGEAFGLGEGLSPTAQRHLDAAVDLVLDWLNAQRAAATERADA